MPRQTKRRRMAGPQAGGCRGGPHPSVLSAFLRSGCPCPRAPLSPCLPILLSLRPISFLRQPILHNFGSVSPLAATLMDPLANVANKTCAMAKSFRCNTYRKHRGWGRGAFLPSSNFSHVSYHETQVLSLHALAHSFAHFCNLAEFNSFLLKRFPTLCTKHGEVGGTRQPKPNNFGGPALSVTIGRLFVARCKPACPVGARTKGWFRGA